MMYAQTPFEDLVWQVEAGADEALEETAGFLHWKAPPRRQAVSAEPAVSGRRATSAPLPDFGRLSASDGPPKADKPPAPLVSAPVKATSLTELRSVLEAFDGCELKKTAMNLVFADGNPEADIMLIGDVPAEEEDRQGLPFAGANGQLLDKMLASIGLDRTKVYLTNLVFWRPPGNRSPSEIEIAACLPFTEQHIRLKAPKLILLCGALTAKTLLRSKDPFSKLRGRWADYPSLAQDGDAFQAKVMPLYHPSYLMRQPSAKRLAWADLVNIKKELTNLSI